MTPAYMTIEDWSKHCGLGRTKIYYLIAEGALRAVKAGKRTLIDVEHGMAWLAALPAPEVTCARKNARP